MPETGNNPPDRFQWKQVLQPIGFTLWAAIVMGGYFLFHKPFTSQTAFLLAQAFVNFTLSAAVLFIAGGIGRMFYQGVDLDPLERVAVQAFLGLGFLGLFWLGIGELGLFFPIVAWMILCCGLVVLGKPIGRWIRDLSTITRSFKNINIVKALILFFVFFFLFSQLLFSLAPPVKWDALVYHLELPRRYIEANGLVFTPDNPFWGYPQIVEMLYTWLMLLSGAEAAQALGWWVGLLFLMGFMGSVNRITQKAGDTSEESWMAGWIGSVIFLAGMTFRQLFSWAYVDLFSVLAGYSVSLSLLRMRSENRLIELLYLGVFCGLGLSIKLTNIVLLVCVGVVWVVLIQQKCHQKILSVLVIGGTALIIYLPWILKNAASTGNPFFPYLFQTEWVNPQRIAGFHQSPGQINYFEIFFLPLAATWRGVEGSAGFASDFGALFLLLGIPGLWQARRSFEGKIILIFLSIGWLVLSIGMSFFTFLAQTRLFLCLLPAGGGAAVWGWRHLHKVKSGNIRIGRIANSVVILIVILSFLQQCDQNVSINIPAIFLNRKTRDSYLDDSLGWYAVAMRETGKLPERSKLLILWEPRGYYAPSFAVVDPWLDQWWIMSQGNASPQDIIFGWREKGYTHILVNLTGVQYFREQTGEKTGDWSKFDDTLELLTHVTDYGKVYGLYRIN
ncbi:MAG TPA: hypothetical protein VIO61_10480 [Anaerolineaceae bacterium]